MICFESLFCSLQLEDTMSKYCLKAFSYSMKTLSHTVKLLERLRASAFSYFDSLRDLRAQKEKNKTSSVYLELFYFLSR